MRNAEDLTVEQVQCVAAGVDYIDSARPAFGSSKYVGLMEQCVNSPVPHVRMLVSDYLWNRINYKKSYPVDLVVRLAKDPELRVARLMIQQLESIAEPIGFETLAELAKSPDVEIQCKAIEALSASGQKRSIAILESLLSSPKNEARIAAKLGLKRLRRQKD